MVVYTWWCWHIYKGGGVCRVEMGSAHSGKWNAYFLLRRMQILVVGNWSKGEEVRSENELIAKTLASVN